LLIFINYGIVASSNLAMNFASVIIR